MAASLKASNQQEILI